MDAVIDTGGEEWRHQCEVRYVLKLYMTAPAKATEYLNRVEDKSPERWKKLKADCRRQWDLGNRGEWGKWL